MLSSSFLDFNRHRWITICIYTWLNHVGNTFPKFIFCKAIHKKFCSMDITLVTFCPVFQRLHTCDQIKASHQYGFFEFLCASLTSYPCFCSLRQWPNVITDIFKDKHCTWSPWYGLVFYLQYLLLIGIPKSAFLRTMVSLGVVQFFSWFLSTQWFW